MGVGDATQAFPRTRAAHPYLRPLWRHPLIISAFGRIMKRREARNKGREASVVASGKIAGRKLNLEGGAGIRACRCCASPQPEARLVIETKMHLNVM
ncbi:MAG: hypothetical protein KatS3mg058_4720 [Roseiflexus sp.]|nr:MAG: hypothetical protein KatS3mg058_4720 [Roseiflexus sp.]